MKNERTEGQRIVDNKLPDVLHVRRPKGHRYRQKGWVSIDVTYWKKALAREIDRTIRRLAK